LATRSSNKKCSKCPALLYSENRTGLCRACLDRTKSQAADDRRANEAAKPADVVVAEDRHKRRQDELFSELKRKYEEALRTIETRDQELHTVRSLADLLETFKIEPKHETSTSEATVVAVASDWHIEERVGIEVGGLNTYNLEIAGKRATKFFQGVLRLTRLLAQDIKIETIVLALLGDFITNDIHEEMSDICEVLPIHALARAESLIVSGIEFLLEHFDGNLVVPCHSGNHARTTKTTRFSSENGHSLEYLMYLHLASYFRNNPRVKFIIPDGPHSYMDVYGQTIRFQHGHMVKYQGGVGGIYIPVNKAIAQWNKARKADLDVFGHFHQLRDGGNFICNGSMIGYNSFALSIKADYEPPKQALFLLDKKRGRTCTWPILF
jgi:hypothetical protein